MLFDRLAQVVALPLPEDVLTADLVDDPKPAAVPAAVLIAVTDRDDPGAMLTVRRPDLRKHPGQIAFPGGRVDPGEDAIAAALREASEETGLDSSLVRIAGVLESYRTVTGFEVTPVLALIPPGLPLAPHEAEVADIFEAPLAHLLDRNNHQRRSALFEGRERHYYEIMWEDRRIWGATAAMIVNLSKRLQWS